MSILSAAHVNLFAGVLNTTPVKVFSLVDALALIQNGTYRPQVQRLQHILATEGEARYKVEKAQLDAVTFCGTFTTRNKVSLAQHSGIVHGDLDHLIDVPAVKTQLCADLHTVYCFASPSGSGLKVGLHVAIVPDDTAYKVAWQAAADSHHRQYGIFWDTSGKDVSRLCFMSDDPDLYFNPNAVRFLVPDAVPVSPPRPTHRPVLPALTLDDSTLLDKAMHASDGPKFTALWGGESSGYASQSEADEALCCLLTFWTQRDPARVDSLFRQSGLYPTIDRKADPEDYLQRTITAAITTVTNSYTPVGHLGVSNNGSTAPQQTIDAVDAAMLAADTLLALLSTCAEDTKENAVYGALPALVPLDTIAWIRLKRQLKTAVPTLNLNDLEHARKDLRPHAPRQGEVSEFFRLKGSREEFIPRWLGEAIIARNVYRHTASQLWVYDRGVYRPCGETTLRADAQALLGDERHEHYLEETLRYVEVATRQEDERPPDCHYINLLDGRLDWATGTLEPHTPECFTTVQLPVAYDPAALCPAFDTYLVTTFDADVHPLIEELLGWCLLPDRRFEQAVMLTGEGENGKSVFLDLVGYLLGEGNVSNVALQDLEDNRFRAAELYGKLANVFADLDARGLQSSSMFKTLTTGDYVTAERKHAQPFRFRSYAKLLFSANKIPASRDKTHAFYRRWTIIPFTRTFDGAGGNPQPDKGLRGKLQRELSGILNRALRGLERLATNDAFAQPQSVIDAKQAYISSNDNVRVFLAECVLAEKNETIVKKRFREVYQNWCDRHGIRAVHDAAIKDALKKAIPNLDESREDKKSSWCWLGITWSADAADYLPS